MFRFHCGYRMFRISTAGRKDFYYNGESIPAEGYRGWTSSLLFRIPLAADDTPEFMWGVVDIHETYGLDAKGAWKTEVQVAYVQEDKPKALLVATGHTRIERR